MLGPNDSLSQALLLLRRAGIRITGGDLNGLSLALPSGQAKSVVMKILTSGPTPSRIATDRTRHPDVAVLYVVPVAGHTVLKAARQGIVDLVALDPMQIIVSSDVLLHEEDKRVEHPAYGHRGKTPWGRLAVERALALTQEALAQIEIAEAAGITQQAVSSSLKNLSEYIVRSKDGWKPKDRHTLIDHWLSVYPGPGGAATYWYSLDSIAQQTMNAVELASGLGADPLVSGDAAADILAPWRLPTGTHLYIREAVDFTDAGFSPANPHDATLTAIIPDDHSLWNVAALLVIERDLPLADPLIVMWDVLRSKGPDAEEAAEKLRGAIEALAVPPEGTN